MSGQSTFRAAVVVEPRRLEVRSFEVPSLADYQVRCEMLYGTTCGGTDLHVIDGQFAFPVKYPAILGHESVGRVVERGSRVRHIQLGDLVTRAAALPTAGCDVAWGGFATSGVAHDHQAMIEDGLPHANVADYRAQLVVPPDIDPVTACLFVNWRETLSYLTRLGDLHGASVLIVGSGATGLSLARMARLLGARHLVLVGSLGRKGLADLVEVDDYLDHRAGSMRSAYRSFEIIVDSIGTSRSVNANLARLTPGGTLGIYGLDEWGRLGVDLSLAQGSFRFYNNGYDESEAHQQVVEWVQERRLVPAPWLGAASDRREYTLDQIHLAYEAVRARTALKALVRLADR